jgi:hypothetical protein
VGGWKQSAREVPVFAQFMEVEVYVADGFCRKKLADLLAGEEGEVREERTEEVDIKGLQSGVKRCACLGVGCHGERDEG